MVDNGEDWRAKAVANLRIAGQARGRLNTKKSQAGCITCKVRRVKCDTGLPVCERCLKSGRLCEGYATTASQPESQDAVVLRRSLITGLVLNTAEAHTMGYFFT